jgi:hypothetical protein
MKKVYIAGPFSHGDVVINLRNAVMAAEEVAKQGYYPFIPHLSCFWHMIAPHPYDFWLDQDLVWLESCDAVIRIPGESSGADQEVVIAQRRGIPVYHSVQSFLEAMNEHPIGSR